MTDSSSFSDLIWLSRELGRPENDYAIQAEGNTSTWIDADTFWVKASGHSLSNIGASGFVAMQVKPVLDLLDGPDLTEIDLKVALDAAKADPTVTARPSIEVALHAILLTLGQARFVGHSHPTAWNAVMCSATAEHDCQGRLFPDHVVVCGPVPLFIPYVDPGVPLAREMRRRLQAHLDQHGEPPKEVFMQNHGFIALGKSALEVERVTAMSVKAARILQGTYAAGGPVFLDQAQIAHLWKRPDEIARRARLTGS